MRNIRLFVEYDGTELSGWQRQDNAPSVQQHLEEAIAQIVQHEVVVAGASRTDAGVSARGQIACFRTERAVPVHGIRRGLNSLLPSAIAIRDADEVPDEFHPRFSATGKLYRYTILARPERSPLLPRAWHCSFALDLDAMRAGAAALVGEHDFSAFRAAGCTAKTTLRRVDDIAISPSGELVIVEIRGNAFLRQMVRIIVGTLVEVATGKLPTAQVAEILASKDRTKAGQTAPAEGLELVEVFYAGTRVSSGSRSR
jgi:tRNA pseudouridine38-40 synthase